MKTALNTSTIRPFALTPPLQVEYAAKAGFNGIELWLREIVPFLQSGGTLKDIKDRLNGMNVTLINGIAFIKWSSEDAAVRAEAFEQAKGELDILARLGSPAIAAPLFGETHSRSLDEIAELYAAFFELCRSFGITPLLETWGRSPVLSAFSSAVYVLKKSGVADKKMLLDIYHAYVAGDDLTKFNEIDMLGLMHLNDYPLSVDKAVITDADRVLPGYGDGHVSDIVKKMKSLGYDGYWSLEIFPKTYGELTAEQALKKCADSIAALNG